MTISPGQVNAARTLLKWSQSDLAGHIGLSAVTVGKFELGRVRPPVLNVSTIQRVFEAAGVEFTNGGQPGVRMKSARPAISDEAALPDIPETDGEPYDGAPV
jgi:transcriptional regulator with XRE-family HTH domain